MSAMVERVALALAKASGINDWFKSAGEFEKEARAAIEAMREPTSEMSRSGANFDDLMPSDAEHIYHKMIDEALK